MTEQVIEHTDKTLAEWREFARTDNCLERMVPSDLRCILVALYDAEKRAAPLAGVKDPEGLMKAVREEVGRLETPAYYDMSKEYEQCLLNLEQHLKGGE